MMASIQRLRMIVIISERRLFSSAWPSLYKPQRRDFGNRAPEEISRPIYYHGR
jgi:hypothetical protein